MTIKVINLTEHPITIFSGTNSVSFNPSGQMCRTVMDSLYNSSIVLPIIGKVPLCLMTQDKGQVNGLSEPAEDTIYLVSSRVLDCLMANGIVRSDVFAPATRRNLGVVLDQRHRIIGVKTLMGIKP